MSNGILPNHILGNIVEEDLLEKRGLKFNYRETTAEIGGLAKKILIAGMKVILINSVLSSILLYTLSIYTAPWWVQKKIDHIRRKFLWKGVGISKG